MNWLEKHIDVFFRFNGFLLIIDIVIGIWATLQLGFPSNDPWSWTAYQWNMIGFLWKPALIDLMLSLILSMLCFMKKYFVFPIILICSIYTLKGGMITINEIMKYGFVYPIANLSCLIGIMEFISATFGTIIWVRKIMNMRDGGKYKNHKHL